MSLDEGKQTDVILLDVSKAFDRVAHVHLCHKLSHLGIKGSLLKWIECFLSDRMQHVIVNGERSLDSRVPVISGVPQQRHSSLFMIGRATSKKSSRVQ